MTTQTTTIIDAVKALDEIREKQGTTKYRLAKSAGMEQTQVNRWFKHPEIVGFATLQKIADLLGYEIRITILKKNEGAE